MTASPGPAAAVCARCRRSLDGRLAFDVQGVRCLRCVCVYRPLLRRSLLAALVVGTLLVAINQGALIFAGVFPAALAWKVPLTYAVPFAVSAWGALMNSRMSP